MPEHIAYWLTMAVFGLTYLGLALGKIPELGNCLQNKHSKQRKAIKLGSMPIMALFRLQKSWRIVGLKLVL